MPFVLLLVLALTITFLQSDSPTPSLGPAWVPAWIGVLITWGGVAALLIAAELLTRWARRQIIRDPSQRYAVLRRLARFRRYHFYVLLAFYTAALFGLGWGWFGKVYLAGVAGEIPGRTFVLLAPFLTVLLFTWARYYDVDCAGRDVSADGQDHPLMSRWAYLGLQARHNLLLVAPPLLLFSIQEIVLARLPGLKDDAVFLPIFFVLLFAAAFVSIPWVLRLMLGLRPLPDGDLRGRLLATAQRLKFRCNDILLWNTRDTIANAMVTGPLPFLRYVVLTDRLISELEPEEIEAVFGHEVGHVKHQHMIFYLGFVLGSLITLQGIFNAVEFFFEQPAVQTFLEQRTPMLLEWFKAWEVVASLPLLLLVALYFFVVFGFLSRRCERQADIYGCRSTSCQVFIDALEKVAHLNGMHRERPGWLSCWLHSTIARRVDFLRRMSADPELEPRFQRRVGLVKWGVSLGLIATMVGIVAILIVLHPQKAWALFL